MDVRPIPGFEPYCASEDGRILRPNGAWASQHLSKRGGYPSVGLWVDGRPRVKTVHRLIALAFHGAPPEGRNDCAHIDGDKTNNRASNLRWASRAENEADKVRHGRSNRGQRNGAAKLADSEAAFIRRAGRTGPRGIQQQLASHFGVTSSAISNIVNGKRRINGPEI